VSPRLTPVILATQEAEIRRIEVQSQPWANSFRAPILKKPFTKRAGGVAQGVNPEFKPQYRKKKKSVNLGLSSMERQIHTHTHTHKERERERARERKGEMSV
jgi:hypothetical protein